MADDVKINFLNLTFCGATDNRVLDYLWWPGFHPFGFMDRRVH